MKLVIVFLGCAFMSTTAAAQDRLWFTASRIDGVSVGSQFDALISHKLWAGATAGVSRFEFGDAQWTTLKLGTAWRSSSSWVLAADAEAGPGRFGDDSFVYRKARVQASYLAEDDVRFALADTWYAIGTDSGHVVAPSVTLSPGPNLSITLETVGTVGAREPTRLAGVKVRAKTRFNWQGGAYYGNTGGAVAQTQFGLLDVAPESRVHQIFAGTQFQRGGVDYQLLVEYFRVASSHQHRVSLLLSVPYGGGRAISQ